MPAARSVCRYPRPLRVPAIHAQPHRRLRIAGGQQLRPAPRPVGAQALREPCGRGVAQRRGCARCPASSGAALAQVAPQHRVDESGGARGLGRLGGLHRRIDHRVFAACAHPRARTAPPTGARAPATSSDFAGCDEHAAQDGLVPIKAAHRAERQRAHRRHQLAGRLRERGLERRIERHPVVEDARHRLRGERARASRRRRSWHAKLAPASGWARQESAAVTGLRPASCRRPMRRAPRPQATSMPSGRGRDHRARAAQALRPRAAPGRRARARPPRSAAARRSSASRRPASGLNARTLRSTCSASSRQSISASAFLIFSA